MTEIYLSSQQIAVDLDNLFAISQIASRSRHWKTALEQILPLLRAVMIFDNLVLYLPDTETNSLEVAYARVVGRGRSGGPELTWGETVAKQVYENGQIYLQQSQPEQPIPERLNQPFLLGVPLQYHDRILGVLVLIRFGGPAYSSDNTRVATFVGERIAEMVEHQELKQQFDRLDAERQQEKLQEDFISTISHELLTPLGFIKGYTTTLLRPETRWDDSSRTEFLTIIDEETDRLQELIDNMLDSARLQSGTMAMHFQPVRMDTLIKDVVMRARSRHQQLEIITEAETPLMPIQGDPRRLAQVFENLITNVVKYAPGGTIQISVKKESHRAHITFKDNGPGISEKHLPHIFERFFRNPEGSPNVRGTGLGLFISRQIIDAHHGDIYAESKPGDGTTFHILLPFDQPNKYLNPYSTVKP